MIRRDWPLGSDAIEKWLLIRQTDHAVASHRLAAAWGNDRIGRLFGGEEESALLEREFLAAVLDHDAGWIENHAAPLIDPEHGRPYSFTEMPPADAQRIWSESIRVCREHGPLAGWIVASHFSALQSKRDRDYSEWIDWLAKVNAQRAGWLAEWRAASFQHTEPLAAKCLAWLQAFDWISLWLGCVCPALPEDAPADPLVVGEGATGWPRLTLTPDAQTTEGERVVRVEPWPFAGSDLLIEQPAQATPIERNPPSPSQQNEVNLRWRLVDQG